MKLLIIGLCLISMTSFAGQILKLQEKGSLDESPALTLQKALDKCHFDYGGVIMGEIKLVPREVELKNKYTTNVFDVVLECGFH